MITIEKIHDSLLNGQRRQMVEQIKEYGEYDFFHDYKNFLVQVWIDDYFEYYTDCVISYHRIINR